MMLYRILFSALDNLLSEKVIQDAVLHTSVSEMILSFKKFLMTDIILCKFILGPCYPAEILLSAETVLL